MSREKGFHYFFHYFEGKTIALPFIIVGQLGYAGLSEAFIKNLVLGILTPVVILT